MEEPQKGIKPLDTWRHGEAPPEPTRWLIRHRLPETGVALLAGQWGTLKTFMWIDLAGAVMTGLNWTGQPVLRRGGVLAFTPEGAATIPMRLVAMVENVLAPRVGERTLLDQAKPDLGRLPFEQVGACPPLMLDKVAMEKMWATAWAANERFKSEHGVELALIVIDTMAAAAGWTREDDNSEVSAAWNLLRNLSEATNSLVLVVDHFGKNAERGTRGGSAKEANSDAVLAFLGEKTMSGEVKNKRLALRKMRDGPAGQELPFGARCVDMGRDQHNYDLTQLVIDWNAVPEPSKPKQAGRKSDGPLVEAMATALREHGRHEQVEGMSTPVVAKARVQELFMAEYGSANENTKRSAWRRALKNEDLREGIIGGAPHLWWVQAPI